MAMGHDGNGGDGEGDEWGGFSCIFPFVYCELGVGVGVGVGVGGW